MVSKKLLPKLIENSFIGREKEQGILTAALESGEAEMVAVIGRRRIDLDALFEAV